MLHATSNHETVAGVEIDRPSEARNFQVSANDVCHLFLRMPMRRSLPAFPHAMFDGHQSIVEGENSSRQPGLRR